MPAILEDPASAPNYRQSGAPPFYAKDSPLPSSLIPFEVKLRNGSPATVVPFPSLTQAPEGLVKCLWGLMSREIEAGDTYPMMDMMPLDKFAPYWFAGCAVVALRGDFKTVEAILQLGKSGEVDWEEKCLGTFYIKPNYPGRSSHICNAGFLVHEQARGQGIGKILGQTYIDWAPKLGYVYSVFNLVYESNTASCRLWDSLGFERIGRVPGCGQLKGYEQLVDAIQYGRHLVSKEELDKRVTGKKLESQKSSSAETQSQKTNEEASVSGVSAKTEVSAGVLL